MDQIDTTIAFTENPALTDRSSHDTSNETVLEGEQALTLWSKGKTAWNQWVQLNPEAHVSFEGIEFHASNGQPISFEEYQFPNGNISFFGALFSGNGVDFSNCQFGRGNIDFVAANFGNGDVDFSNTQFGEGNVDFSESQFGHGLIDFSLCEFGSGSIDFFGAKLGDGGVDFSGTKFGDGYVDFSLSEFGEGKIEFSSCEFGKGYVYFSGTKFGDGQASFAKTQFSEGDVNFSRAEFGEGDIEFTGAVFGEGEVTFSTVQFGSGDVDFSFAWFGDSTLYFDDCVFSGENVNFSNATFRGAYFENIHLSETCQSFSFKHSSFNGPLTLYFPEMVNFVPDLVGTKTSHHVSLNRLYCTTKRTSGFLIKRCLDPNDAERLGRLMELSEYNKDHQSALRFHAEEMRARRWHSTPTLASILDLAFDITSDYGQSIVRPFALLFSAIFLLTLYAVGAPFPAANATAVAQWWQDLDPQWIASFELAVSRTLPFIGGVREEGREAYIAISEQLPAHFGAVSFLFSVMAFGALFLIGLGLRNRFRI